MPKKDETITITKTELEDMLSRKEREAKLTDDERRVRTMIGEVIEDKLRELFDFDGAGGDGAGADAGADDKPEPKGFLDGLLGK